MDSEYDNLIDHEMYLSPNSSRASTPSIPDNTHENCQKRKHLEKELETYTDSISHNEILLKNLERQGLQNYAIYVNQWRKCRTFQCYCAKVINFFPINGDDPGTRLPDNGHGNGMQQFTTFITKSNPGQGNLRDSETDERKTEDPENATRRRLLPCMPHRIQIYGP
ncbi:hypothetical protein NPIL_3801 [Nephila pilipes]|uniref:Uncharacterized protein n=1 Tax=Nephila pilipes TaxID=299642 RepID=A0A8X6MQU8_NEPPI|nr:hypothetical protein NPIL_3801 [Nephila pilipes]